MEKLWKDKKVYLTTHSKRVYSGLVLDETEVKLILRDIKGHLVELSKIDINFIQEES